MNLSEHLMFLEPGRSIENAMQPHYVPALVILSFFIAMFAAYTALLVSIHMQSIKAEKDQGIWVAAGAFALGGGIWAMHFVGMLAYQLPVVVQFDIKLTLLSGLPALFAGVILLRAKPEQNLSISRLLVQSLLLGGGIGAMHYAGMAAMQLDGEMVYAPFRFGASIVIAVVLAGFALGAKFWAFKTISIGNYLSPRLLIASAMMGAAIAGMHYSGMLSMLVFPIEVTAGAARELTWSASALVVVIGIMVTSVSAILIFSLKISHLIIINEVGKARETQTQFEAKKALEARQFAFDQHAVIEMTDAKGTIISVNKKFCELSGYTQEELVGGNHRMLSSGEKPKQYWRDMFRTISNGEVWHGQIRNRAKDGSLFWVETTIVPIVWGAEFAPGTKKNDVKGYIAIRTDITEQKRQEQKLIESKLAAEAATLAKSKFLATMSHEIRTPMNGVIGMAQLLEDTPLSDEQKDYAATIISSGNALLSIINDVLDFSKLDADMFEVEKIEFDLEKTSLECIELISGNSTNKHVEFILAYQADCPRLFLGDSSRMRQVLVNLLGNAAKFTRKGHVYLRVIWDNERSESGHLRIEVQDTGIGLKPEAVENIFDEFTQADDTTTRNFGGTGLGLAISKKLIELMGGEIGINSKFGEGSTFWIDMNLEKAGSEPCETLNPLVGVQILFVNGNLNICQIYSQLLSALGADVCLLQDADEVMGQLRKADQEGRSTQILILDQHLSSKSGLEMGIDIRKDPQFDSLKLLVLSSVGQRGDAATFARAGFDAYLGKLCLYETLQAVLLAMLDHNSAQAILTRHSVQKATQVEGQEAQSFAASILLVDDVLLNLMIARKFLTNMGLEVEVARNGQEAVDSVAKNSYDLIFMDCRMPVMDGYDATRAIRVLELDNNKKPTPIVALTANATEDDRLLCKQVGMNDVLTKPFKKADLSDCLQQWLPH